MYVFKLPLHCSMGKTWYIWRFLSSLQTVQRQIRAAPMRLFWRTCLNSNFSCNPFSIHTSIISNWTRMIKSSGALQAQAEQNCPSNQTTSSGKLVFIDKPGAEIMEPVRKADTPIIRILLVPTIAQWNHWTKWPGMKITFPLPFQMTRWRSLHEVSETRTDQTRQIPDKKWNIWWLKKNWQLHCKDSMWICETAKGRHIGAGDIIKYVIWWDGYGPNIDNLEQQFMYSSTPSVKTRYAHNSGTGKSRESWWAKRQCDPKTWFDF